MTTDSTSQKFAFFQGKVVPLEQARVSVMTHAFNYGTGVFEGIRGYWNEEREEIYIVFLREHYTRFLRNCRMLCIDASYSLDELVTLTVDLVRRHQYRGDVYIRPLAYKSSEHIGVSMEGVADDFTVFCSPYGNYVDIDRGLAVAVSSWRRSDDNAIPGRAKVTGNYVNSALAKNEAVMNGYDEAIFLNSLGFVCESSASNLFIVRDGVLVTPSVADGILEGYTRGALMTLAAEELGIRTEQRSIGRSELYYAEEVFLAGTGVQLAPVTSVDRRQVGTGEIGPISATLQRLYFEVVKGRVPKYLDWLTPVYAPARTEVPSAVAG